MNNNLEKKPILIAKNISKHYTMGTSKVEVLKDISLEINNGEIVTIVGPSGVGKSTLLHIIGTLDHPSNGSLEIESVDIFSKSSDNIARFRNNEIGFVFQFHHLLPEFSALENVMLPAMIAKHNMNEIKERACKLLDGVGLSQRYNHRPGELSGGEQQRVAVARALINGPKLLLADEPSGNLDKNSSISLHKLLWTLNKKYKQTIIIVTHNLDLSQRADRIIELSDGKIKRNVVKGET